MSFSLFKVRSIQTGRLCSPIWMDPRERAASTNLAGSPAIKCAMAIWQGDDVIAYRMGKLMRLDMTRSVGIDVVTPARHDQPTLLQKLGLVDIHGAHAVTLLMAHLPLNRRVRPKPRFEQGATSHGPETMPADVLGGVVPHIAQHLVNRVLRQGLPVPVITGQHQFREPIQAAQPFKDLDDLRRQRHYLNVPLILVPCVE